MEKKSVKIWVVLGVLIALAGAQCGEADSVYACLGGCYNQCVVLARKSGASRYPCYIGCINGCVPRTTAAADYQNYCQIGCNLQLCSPTRYDGAQLEKCVGRCGNICNRA
nr:uncharacterized protein LOC109154273 [Ipomoea trifida]